MGDVSTILTVRLLGLSLHVWLGLALVPLLLLQVATGKRWLKLNFAWHRRNAVLLTSVALLHAAMALWLMFFRVW